MATLMAKAVKNFKDGRILQIATTYMLFAEWAKSPPARQYFPFSTHRHFPRLISIGHKDKYNHFV